MGAALACTAAAVTMTLSPPSSQFHTLEHFSLTCPSPSWTVFRTTVNKKTPERCEAWGKPQSDGMGCKVGPTMESDSGSYWCQNHNQTSCSPPANIIVTENKVIVHSPVFPVEEEERCLLLQNNTLVGEFPKGEMVLESVAEADEGPYRCEHRTYGSSLESFLDVKPKVALQLLVTPTHTPTTAPLELKEKFLHRIQISVNSLSLFLLSTVIFCISISIYCKCSRARAGLKQQESQMVSL
ncbi:hypothetical protein WMY93_014282 [Mugilogobius chulae]|uniref:Ig-like domain-containing protein n=1 Tax=Mugilogobius chulae TaxID=88201 RepID=A0AAW0P417_9GOBI